MDANVFITAKNEYYGFDFCPGFWNWVKKCPDLRSVQAVYQELSEGNDDLKDWVKELAKTNKDFFLQTTEEVQIEYAAIIEKLTTHYNRQTAINEYLDAADSWLIATAKCHNYTIVTNEKCTMNFSQRRIRIPEIAFLLGINCIRVFDVMRQAGVQLEITH